MRYVFFHCRVFALILIFFKDKFCIKSISLVAEFSGAPLDCVPEGSTLLAPGIKHASLRSSALAGGFLPLAPPRKPSHS